MDRRPLRRRAGASLHSARLHAASLNCAALCLALVIASCASRAPEPRAGVPWSIAAETWRDDPTWYDGQAEVAVYAATRPIYGVARRYEARAYTNVQAMDPSTTTKSSEGRGIEVFKHHWSERVPTERYDYDFSTALFVERANLAAYKWTCATQEDCGASFKQAWRSGAGWRSFESVYFPDGGQGGTEHDGPLPLPFDALTLVLRDFPFEAEQSLELMVAPSQRDTHSVSWDPVAVRVTPRGRERIEVPAGALDAWRLDVDPSSAGAPAASYWFAADDAAPNLGVLLRYEDDRGVTFELVRVDRYPYWSRGPR